MSPAGGSLRERLAKTRARIVSPAGDAPAPPPPPAPPSPPGSRAERIAELRARLHRGGRDWRGAGKRQGRDAPPRTARRKPGKPFERREATIPLGRRWGATTLRGLRRPSQTASARLRARAGEAGVDFSRTLFVDTETSGLAGGTGTFAFLIGIGHVEGDAFRVVQFLMRSPAGERAMLDRIREFARAVGGDRPHVVTYNGASFDLPLLDARFALKRVANPFRLGPHLDLLHPARRLFRPGHGGARLMHLERSLLGVERDDDIPGHEIPQVFFRFLRKGQDPRMESVVAHNRADIVSLAALAVVAAERMDEAWDTEDPVDLFAVGRHFERRGEEEAAAGFFARALAAGLGGDRRDSCLLRLGESTKRRGDWEEAAALWRRIETRDSGAWMQGLEWLAKWQEHHRKSPRRALLHVEDALERLPRVGFGREAYAQWRKQLDHRRRRLTRATDPRPRRRRPGERLGSAGLQTGTRGPHTPRGNPSGCRWNADTKVGAPGAPQIRGAGRRPRGRGGRSAGSP